MSKEIVEGIMDGLSILNLTILTLGIIGGLKRYKEATAYFGALIVFEILSVYAIQNNLFLFSLSYYLHLFCIAFYLMIMVLKLDKKLFWWILPPLIIPMILSLLFNRDATMYQSYDWQFYNLCIILFCMLAFLKQIGGKVRLTNPQLLFLSLTLFYFTLDLVLALTVNYLVNQPLSLVQGIWFFRAFCLSLFYVGSVQLIWRHKAHQ
ncbi:MAG: hypothetical protein MI810_00460 [Flavobacteriales bacterium]|nr:hypothetical protein [Flavobacteriales bacterium]